MMAAPKETVVLVHGTFAAPRNDGPLQWYQPGSEFCRRLDSLLADRNSSARCWHHGHGSPFFWSGRNSWHDREEAAAALAEYLARLLRDGWTCHVVAHSHGGNVLWEALTKKPLWVNGYPDAEAWSGGKLVTLGTPFLDSVTVTKSVNATQPVRVAPHHRRAAAVTVLAVLAVYWRTLSATTKTLGHWLALLPQHFASWIFIVMAVCVLPFIARVLRGIQIFGRTFDVENTYLLALYSEADEAIGFLRSLQTAVPPKSPREAGTRVRKAWCLDIGGDTAAKRAAKLAYPFRFNMFGMASLLALLGLVTAVEVTSKRGGHVSEVARTAIPILSIVCVVFCRSTLAWLLFLPARYGTYAYLLLRRPLIQHLWRRYAWDFIVAASQGREDHPLGPAGVLYTPESYLFCEPRPLPPEVVDQAISRRTAQGLPAFEELLRAPAVAPAAAQKALEQIERTALVHTAYYEDETAVALIADWLALWE